MKKQKIIDILIYSATGITITHGLLSLLIISNKQLFDVISYHYSDSLTWYVIYLFIPSFVGMAFYFWLKHKYISKVFKILLGALFILQIAFTITGTIINYNYWGYAFKRPSIFNEISNADKVLTCSKISNLDSSGVKLLHVIEDSINSLDNLYGRRDLYYGKIDRSFMAFQDNAHINGYLYDVPNVYQDKKLKASKGLLLCIDKLIKESGLLDYGEKNWDTSGQLSGILSEFTTINKLKYIFVGLSGGQVSNDHYPFYEFLFIENNRKLELVKKQKFYTDIAGYEGFEYANIAPIFSLLLTVFGLVMAILIHATNEKIKQK